MTSTVDNRSIAQDKTWKYFEQNPITHSAAHYLMTIFELRSENGYARVTDISKRLDISAASCSTSIKNLKKKKLVREDKNKFLELTKLGQKYVERIQKNDELLSVFFKEVLHVDNKQAEVDACKIEHLLSQETAAKLAAFLTFVRSKNKTANQFMEIFHQLSPSCIDEKKTCEFCEQECVYKI